MAYNYLQDLVSSAYGFDGRKYSEKYIGGQGFGKGWSDSDASLLNLMAQSAQNNMQLDLIADERAYNNPLRQVNRLRNAGINPDLQNIDTGNTSVGSPVSAPTATGAPQADFVRDVLPQLPSLLNSAIGVYSQIQGLQQSNNAIKAQKLSNLGTEQDLIKQSYFTYLDDLGKYYDASEQFRLGKISKEEFNQIGIPNSSDYAILSAPLSYSKRDKKAFERSFHQYVKLHESSLLKEYEENRLSKTKTRFENAKYEGFESQLDRTLSVVLGEFMKNEFDATNKRNIESQKRENFQTSISEDQATIIDNQATLSTRSVQDSDSRGIERDLLSKLYQDYKDGNLFSGVLLMIINATKDSQNLMQNIF